MDRRKSGHCPRNSPQLQNPKNQAWTDGDQTGPQKAYDRVSWDFIHTVLLHLGFNEVYSNWVLYCISSVTFEILVNGGKTDKFKPSRGLRQGDPLSPYLLILGQEILSRMLDHELRQSNIKGIKTSKSGPTITHVMYANDIVLFSKTTKKDAETISKILEKYSLWSGQLVNRSKLGIFFLQAHSESHPKVYQKYSPILGPSKETPHILEHRYS